MAFPRHSVLNTIVEEDSHQGMRERNGEQSTLHSSYLAFSKTDNHQASVSGKSGGAINPSALIHFQSIYSLGELFVLCSFQQITMWSLSQALACTVPRFSGFRFPYLLHCPCCLCTGSPWLRHSLLLSSLAGKHNASRFGPAYISHCCCTSRGSPLPRQGRKDNSDLSMESICT